MDRPWALPCTRQPAGDVKYPYTWLCKSRHICPQNRCEPRGQRRALYRAAGRWRWRSMRLTSGRWRKRCTRAAWYAALCFSRGSSTPFCALAFACAPANNALQAKDVRKHLLPCAAAACRAPSLCAHAAHRNITKQARTAAAVSSATCPSGTAASKCMELSGTQKQGMLNTEHFQHTGHVQHIALRVSPETLICKQRNKHELGQVGPSTRGHSCRPSQKTRRRRRRRSAPQTRAACAPCGTPIDSTQHTLILHINSKSTSSRQVPRRTAGAARCHVPATLPVVPVQATSCLYGSVLSKPTEQCS